MPPTEDEKQEAEERSAPTGTVVYEAIFSEGTAELERSTRALLWSGLAAGLSMSFSFITSSILHAALPDTKWRDLVVALGYPVGFIIVILGRQQLFTENTLTVILPLLTKRNRETFLNVCRLWAAVLVANLIGAILVALVLAKTEVVTQETFQSMRALAKTAPQGSFSVVFLRGIFAGWLIAMTVWLLPYAETARVWVIAIITYVIGAAHFSHVIAGAVESAFLVITGGSSWAEFALGFFIPSLLGNIVGGVLLVAVLNHAQVVAGTAE
ncbi:MAG TPA: formate/nitrite transporter family protein [Thermoanaerobaculia bacterium]|jgi:formate/nitrite transporter FocA (FNT family)